MGFCTRTWFDDRPDRKRGVRFGVGNWSARARHIHGGLNRIKGVIMGHYVRDVVLVEMFGYQVASVRQVFVVCAWKGIL